MSENSAQQSKKPAFFRTLPENIATSPTGIVKISNSPFPSLDPTKQFRSVYERAGFDVYRPNKTRQSSRVTSPVIKENGFRSQSTSQLNQQTGMPKVFDEKRNFSEHHNISHSNHNYGDPIPGFNKATLTIDANLANGSKDGEFTTHLSTGSTATSTFDRAGPKPLNSSTSSTFTDTEPRSASTETSFKFREGSSSHFVSAQSLPYSARSKRSSKDSTHTYNTSPSSSRTARESNGYHSPAQSIPRISPTRKLFAPQNHPNEPEEQQGRGYMAHETNDLSFQASTGGDRSIDTVKYTPEERLEPSLDVSMNHVPGGFPDKSYESVNPLSNSTSFDVSDPIDVISDDGVDNSDDESFKSEILSPKNQHFNFENGKDQQLDDSLSFGQDSTQRDISLQLPVSPPQSQQQEQHNTIPQLTVSDTEGNYVHHDDFLPPSDYKKSSDMRQSAVSIAASSIYSNDNRQSITPISEFETIEEHEFESYPDLPKSSGPVYEEIEQQLESLSMKSPQPSQPPQILIHSLKEVSTDAFDEEHGEPEDVQEFQKANGARSIDNVSKNNEYLTQDQDEYVSKSPNLIEEHKEEPEVPKYPAGEGPCRKCGLEIERKPIYSKSGELSGQWHRECFTCTLCDLKFNKNTSCFVLKDLPYCEYHYHLTNNSLCKVCGKGIVGKCLENDAEDRYHLECLKCTKCGDSIKSDYLSINGKVHCESCATEFTSGSRTNDPNDVIERRRTKLYFI